MNKKSIALIFGLLVLMVLFIIGGSFYMQSINEANLIRRNVHSIRAFWAAETGVAESLRRLRDCAVGGECTVTGITDYSEDNYQYDASTSHLGGSHYRVDSTGSGGGLTENVSTVVRIRDIDPGNIPYAIETQGDINVKGSAEIDPPDSQYPNSPNWRDYADNPDYEDYFHYIFGFTKEEVKSLATHIYTDPSNDSDILPCEGVVWVELIEKDKLSISSGTWQGSGILIVEGDLNITGGNFDGIIYAMGQCSVPAGNPIVNGAVFVENEPTDITDLRGNLTLNYDPDAIEDALNNLKFTAPHRMAWWQPS